jgi:hypothetical protein
LPNPTLPRVARHRCQSLDVAEKRRQPGKAKPIGRPIQTNAVAQLRLLAPVSIVNMIAAVTAAAIGLMRQVGHSSDLVGGRHSAKRR